MDGQEFLKTFDMELTDRGVINGGMADRQRDRMVKEKWSQLYKIGWDTVTVCNCLPWQLDIHTTYGYFRVPAPDRKKGELVRLYTIVSPSMAIRDLGDAKYVPEVVMPVEIAEEFTRKYAAEGGVFWIKTPKDQNDETYKAELAAKIEEAHDKMKQWFKARFQLAQANWSRYNKNPYFIDDRMRDAARFLYERALIAELPEWISTTRDEATTKECPACGEVVKRAAKICVHCKFAIDPDFVAANRDRLGMQPAQADADNIEEQPKRTRK